jgi:hypothetical protein
MASIEYDGDKKWYDVIFKNEMDGLWIVVECKEIDVIFNEKWKAKDCVREVVQLKKA